MCVVEANILERVPSSVELILVANGKRVMEPMTFELLEEEEGKPSIRLVN